jgi:hypothetical protein
MTRMLERLQEQAGRTRQRYGPDRPLGGYAGAMAAYVGSCLALVGAGRLAGRRLPDRIGPADLALVAVATHKLSRLLSKDAVSSPLRAPFTEFERAEGEGEVGEQVRAGGHAHALGEMLSCPFCLDQWVATGFVAGTVLAPRPTRLAASLLTAVAGADWLHIAYAAARQSLH